MSWKPLNFRSSISRPSKYLKLVSGLESPWFFLNVKRLQDNEKTPKISYFFSSSASTSTAQQTGNRLFGVNFMKKGLEFPRRVLESPLKVLEFLPWKSVQTVYKETQNCWHCEFLISYLGKNKQKEGGGNKLQGIGSVIHSISVQVCSLVLRQPSNLKFTTQLCRGKCDQNLASFKYFPFKSQKFILGFSHFNSHSYLAQACGGFMFKSVGETPSLAMKKGAKLIFIPFQHLSCSVVTVIYGTAINQHEHCQHG